MVAGQSRARTRFPVALALLGGAHAHLLRGGPTAKPSGVATATPVTVRSRLEVRSSRCGFALIGEPRRCCNERSTRGPSGGRVRPANSTRTTGSRSTQRGQRCFSPQDSVHVARNAAQLVGMGDHRPWGNTGDADRVSRVALHPALVDRGGVWLFPARVHVHGASWTRGENVALTNP